MCESTTNTCSFLMVLCFVGGLRFIFGMMKSDIYITEARWYIKPCHKSAQMSVNLLQQVERLKHVDTVEREIKICEAKPKRAYTKLIRMCLLGANRAQPVLHQTWKWRMMVHISPRVSFGFPSAMSSFLMFTSFTCQTMRSVLSSEIL